MTSTTRTPSGGMAQVRLGKYEIRRELGRGAMGVVYIGYDPELEREVALKTMSVSLATVGDDEKLRFRREARSAAKLRHPNIVTIYELGEDAGTPFMAMELLDGTDLCSLLRAGELPPLWRRLEIVARLCEGLEFAHVNGIVHRDVKPANVFICTDGAVKILDFGLAKLPASDATRTGLVLGTVDYMSPEQVRADRNLDGRSDIFSAGVILYELVLRGKPFTGESLASSMYRIVHEPPAGFPELLGALPEGLARILEQALEKDRERRFTRAGEMSEQLDRAATALAGQPGLAALPRSQGVSGAGAIGPGPGGVSADRLASAAASGVSRSRGVLDEGSGREELKEPGKPPSLWAGLALAGALSLVFLVGLILALAAVRGRTVEGRPPGAVTTRTTFERRMAGATQPRSEAGERTASQAASPAPIGPAEGASSSEAISKPSAPDAIGAGSLVISVLPWARLRQIENLDSGEKRTMDEATPLRLAIPPGRYRLLLDHPGLATPMETEAEVRPGGSTLLARKLPGFEPRLLQRALFGGGRTSEGLPLGPGEREGAFRWRRRGERSPPLGIEERRALEEALLTSAEGNLTEAIRQLGLVRDAAPDSPGLRLLLGAAYYDAWVLQGGWDEDLLEGAKAEMGEARRLDPSLRPDPRFFSPKLIAFYDSAR